tara:strand:+ start:1315 stop:1458 length:144 start_codon:yes stop_codon:yes gene_type:complete
MNKFLDLHIKAATPKQSIFKMYTYGIINTIAFLMFTATMLFILVGCA